VSIIEICDRSEHGLKENFYLQKYLPLLNSTFNSNFSEASVYDTLRNILKSKQETRLNSYSSVPIEVLVYSYNGINIDQNYISFTSISEAYKHTNISRSTISAYLDTNVPIKGLLFFSKPIEDLKLTLSLVKESEKSLPLSDSESKPV